MSCVHYKFASKLNYDTVTFTGLHISLRDLKRQIMVREKLKAANCDLQITNAQSREEYADDNALIPKNSSVIVRRIPAGGVKAASKRCPAEPVSGTSKAIGDSSASLPLAHLIKTANLAEANASEEDKIKAVMIQSCREYDPINYRKEPLGLPPPWYTCFRCGEPGHYIQHCPTNGDKTVESVPRIKRSRGIPRSFLIEVKDPTIKGVMLTNTGKYAIPAINAEAYARGKKERPPFLPEEPSTPSSSDDPTPEELLCPICKEIMTDAVVIPCCANSYCDECIRTALLECEEHTCPTCHQTDVSPDALIANKFLRQAVNNFKNGTGHTKRLCKQSGQQGQQWPPAPPPALVPGAPPAALVTAAGPSTTSSLATSSVAGEKVPAGRQPASPSLLGPQGQAIPTAGPAMRAGGIHSAGGTPGWELSKSPCSAPSYSGSLHTYSKPRTGFSCSHSSSQSFVHSHSRSYSPSPPYPRRGKEKSGNDRCGSRSPPSRRYRSRSRSPVFRGQSPTKRTTPQGEGEGEYFNRNREVPACSVKAYCGRSVDLRDPFEKESYREWERNFREWCEQIYKGCAVGTRPQPDPTGLKMVSEKERKEKGKPKAKLDKRKRQAEVAVPPQKDSRIKPAEASQEKVDTDGERSLRMEPPVKKVKGE